MRGDKAAAGNVKFELSSALTKQGELSLWRGAAFILPLYQASCMRLQYLPIFSDLSPSVWHTCSAGKALVQRRFDLLSVRQAVYER